MMEDHTPQNSEPADPREPANLRSPRGCGGIFFAFMVVFAGAWGACLGTFAWLLEEANANIQALDTYRPKVGSRVYAANNNELLGEFTKEVRRLVNLHEMPLCLPKAFIATEDDHFYSHKGVRPESIAKAVFEGIRSGRFRGASTITQQLVRNVEQTDVSQERTLQRKIVEALVALQVERQFTKDEIIELYLNKINLGRGMWGVEAASQLYYGKSCRDLTLPEAALLAGLARSPSRNEPINHPENARERRDIVLGQMLANGFVTEEEHREAVATPVEDLVQTPEERTLARERSSWAPRVVKAPYFVEDVRLQVINDGIATMDELTEQGLEIYTTLDMRLQRAAEEILERHLAEFDAKKLKQLQAAGRENEFVPVTGALVCIDNRPGSEGFIRAMVGGRDWDTNKYNNVTMAKRQPGSSIKPFVWAAALDHLGYTLSHIEYDSPYLKVDNYGNRWEPKNFSGDYQGPITLRNALAKSVNIVSIKLVEKLRPPIVQSYMTSMGVATPINVQNLTIALGTPEITVLDQCVAFSTFAKQGIYTPPVLVREIRDNEGFPIYTAKIERKRVLPADVGYVMQYALEGVCKYGTGTRSNALKHPHGGKTGTTNDARDVWFCGFTVDYTCVVWVGYRDNRSLGSGRNYTGGVMACPIWTDFMVKAHEGQPMKEFERPPTVTMQAVDKNTGTAGGGFQEAFAAGTAPPAAYVVASEPVDAATEALAERVQLVESELLDDPGW